MAAARAVMDHSRHSEFSDPGRWAHLLREVPATLTDATATVRNVIVHYRNSGQVLPETSRDDIDLRWVRDQLAVDQHRHRTPLRTPRCASERLQGCCRDHSLLAVAILREHGIPARTRVGFAGYFVEGWFFDHVVVETWMGGRWRLFDSELEQPRGAVRDPSNITWSTPRERGFCSAGAAWLAYRRGEVDLGSFGVAPEVPDLRGAAFAADQVIRDIAHRFGRELLLWDSWGAVGRPARRPDDMAWLDDLAHLSVRADHAVEAERELLTRFAGDARLRVPRQIVQTSPLNSRPIAIRLRWPDR